MEAELARLATLGDPTRRAIYLYLVSSGEAVGRDEAARAVGVTRQLAAFHLERLLESGLVVATHRRLSGRTGPGAGRPAKLYKPAGDIAVTVPERRFELLADVLGDAQPDLDAVRRAARERGLLIGQGARGRAGILARLRDHGFEPETKAGAVWLRNCPFDNLSRPDPRLVCELNFALVTGMCDAAAATPFEPELDPAPGRCCVVLRKRPAAPLRRSQRG